MCKVGALLSVRMGLRQSCAPGLLLGQCGQARQGTMAVRCQSCHALGMLRRSGVLLSERVKKAGAPLHQGLLVVRTAVWAAAILLAAHQTRRSTRQAVDALCTALTRCRACPHILPHILPDRLRALHNSRLRGSAPDARLHQAYLRSSSQ